MYHDASEVFEKLSMYRPVFWTKKIRFLKDVSPLYMACSTTDIDIVRQDIIVRKQKLYDAILPASTNFDFHLKRVAYRAGCICGQSATCQMEELSRT